MSETFSGTLEDYLEMMTADDLSANSAPAPQSQRASEVKDVGNVLGDMHMLEVIDEGEGGPRMTGNDLLKLRAECKELEKAIREAKKEKRDYKEAEASLKTKVELMKMCHVDVEPNLVAINCNAGWKKIMKCVRDNRHKALRIVDGANNMEKRKKKPAEKRKAEAEPAAEEEKPKEKKPKTDPAEEVPKEKKKKKGKKRHKVPVPSDEELEEERDSCRSASERAMYDWMKIMMLLHRR